MARKKIEDQFSSIKNIQVRHRARRFSEGRCYIDGNELDEKAPGVLYKQCRNCREKRKDYLKNKPSLSNPDERGASYDA